MPKHLFSTILISLVALLVAAGALAGVGVGVNLGKIKIDKALIPGGVYNLPSIGVINTGDETSDYELAVTFLQDQPELRPAPEWFSFNPSQFQLAPSESQPVAVQLTLPVKTEPGDYFAFLEAHPVVKAGPGTTIGVAAATKINFTVAPANLWQAMTHRISSFFRLNAPWTYVVLVVVIGAILIAIFRKFFALQIGISKKK